MNTQIFKELIPGKLTMVYRAFNDSHLIIPIFNYLAKVNIFPLLALDDRSHAGELLKYRASNINFVLVNYPKRYAESGLKNISEIIDTPFYLLLDSDEIIIDFDLNEIERIVNGNTFHVVGLRRIWLYDFSSTLRRFKFSRSRLLGDDIQYRLIRKSEIDFHTDLMVHSSGFDWNDPDSTTIMENNQILHLDWIVNSPEERIKKLVKYSEFDKSYLLKFLYIYVPEVGMHTHNFRSKALNLEIKKLIKSLKNQSKQNQSWWD